MKTSFFSVLVFLLGLTLTMNGNRLGGPAEASAQNAAQKIDWTIVFYAGLDEEEIAGYTDPVIAGIIGMQLPDNVELLLQDDSQGTTNDARYIRRGRTTTRIPMPEVDSGSPAVFQDFITWAKSQATGRHVIFLTACHSWGWKGVVQDFGIPDKPGANTMIPLREFTRILAQSGIHFDVVMMDGCILGTAEALEYLTDAGDYIGVSQRETPYSGFPYSDLFTALGQNPTPLQVAQDLPQRYVQAFSRGGKNTAQEGEYFVNTYAVVDSKKWASFRSDFTTFVSALKQADLHSHLEADPKWRKQFTDEDSNIDLVEFLNRVGDFVQSDDVKTQAQKLLREIGYPEELSHFMADTITISPEQADEVDLVIQADELETAGGVDSPKLSILDKIERTWWAENQDLPKPSYVRYTLQDSGTGADHVRTLTVKAKVHDGYTFRPWINGAQSVHMTLIDTYGNARTETLHHAVDYAETHSFPATSFLISEAHTQGAPFIHGIGVNVEPNMNNKEARGEDPIWKLKGPDFYRAIRWNQVTGWADAVLGPKITK